MAEECDRGIAIDGPDDSGAVRRFSVKGFVALWGRQRVIAADLFDDPTVIASLTRSGRVEIDDDGILVAVHGLAARPTRHRIEHHDGTTHTWCALDAIGIPAALDLTADAVTSCPTCETELRVHLDQGVPAPHPDVILWLPATTCEHLVNDFCNHANLYCSPAHLATTVPPTSNGTAITVAEVADIGRHTWSDAAKELSR
jgi:hypothetical protein